MNYALQTHRLVKRFGTFPVLNEVSLNITQGARHALIGPNGAGKTTLLNVLTGFQDATSGSVSMQGQDITHMAAHRRCKLGLVRTFQMNQLFAEMTVLESVTMAVCERLGLGARWWRTVDAYPQARDEAVHILEQLHLLPDAAKKTHTLAYGRQRLVEMALALAAKPRVLLLDEPAAGVSASESHELFATIASLPQTLTILLIEHDMTLVFRFAERISVLANGGLLAEGAPEDIATDPRVKQVYLGEALHV